ncbi:hypothetical protein HII31_07609 [Pseudocercospora fuligena]|uniref:Uncharacterized protein n=1 Tax=Pseudocercospora fuligena TaxID=685502 RepID=A0A8H6RGF9_9PEZI|nr:hypothetical protein HII31_07609 [Pseudocercospora fuligena]
MSVMRRIHIMLCRAPASGPNFQHFSSQTLASGKRSKAPSRPTHKSKVQLLHTSCSAQVRLSKIVGKMPSGWTRFKQWFTNPDATEIRSRPNPYADPTAHDSKRKSRYVAVWDEQPKLKSKPKRRRTSPHNSRPPVSYVARAPAPRPTTSGADGRVPSRSGYTTRPVAPPQMPQQPYQQMYARPSTSNNAYSRTGRRPWDEPQYRDRNAADLRAASRTALLVSKQESWFDDSSSIASGSTPYRQYSYRQPIRQEERWPPRDSSRNWRRY